MNNDTNTNVFDKNELPRAWLRAFIASPHIPPSRHSEERIYYPIRRLIEVASLVTEDMLPALFTKLYVAYEPEERSFEIVTQTLSHFIGKYPIDASKWATERLRNEQFASTAISELTDFHKLGIPITDMPPVMYEAEGRYKQIITLSKPGYGAALYSHKDETGWKKQIYKLIDKLLDSGIRRNYGSTRNFDGEINKDKYNYYLGSILSELKPFWSEKKFQKLATKTLKQFNVKHFIDATILISSQTDNSKVEESKLQMPFIRMLVQGGIDYLRANKLMPSSSEDKTTLLVFGLVQALEKVRAISNSDYHELASNFKDCLLSAEIMYEAAAELMKNSGFIDFIKPEMPEFWNKYLSEKYGHFDDNALEKFIEKSKDWMLLNAMSKSSAKKIVSKALSVTNNQPTWESLLTYFAKHDNNKFSNELQQSLAELPVIKQLVLKLVFTENNKRPSKFSTFSILDGWVPPFSHPVIELLSNMYPSESLRWNKMYCSFYDNPTDFDEYSFSQVLEALTGKTSPSRSEAIALTDSLGFSIDDLLATIVTQDDNLQNKQTLQCPDDFLTP